MPEDVKVARKDEIARGTAKVVEANGREIAVYNVDGEYYATTNVCPHQGGPLGEGMVENRTVICPWHAWAFDVKTGESPLNPRARIETYPVKVEGDDLYVRL